MRFWTARILLDVARHTCLPHFQQHPRRYCAQGNLVVDEQNLLPNFFHQLSHPEQIAPCSAQGVCPMVMCLWILSILQRSL